MRHLSKESHPSMTVIRAATDYTIRRTLTATVSKHKRLSISAAITFTSVGIGFGIMVPEAYQGTTNPSLDATAHYVNEEGTERQRISAPIGATTGVFDDERPPTSL